MPRLSEWKKKEIKEDKADRLQFNLLTVAIIFMLTLLFIY